MVLIELILTVSTLGGFGSLERTDFNSPGFMFLLWETSWEGVAVLKELILTVSTLGGCGNVMKNLDLMFLLCKGVVVLKVLDFNSFYFGKGVAVLKELILTVSTLGMCGSLEKN